MLCTLPWSQTAGAKRPDWIYAQLQIPRSAVCLSINNDLDLRSVPTAFYFKVASSGSNFLFLCSRIKSCQSPRSPEGNRPSHVPSNSVHPTHSKAFQHSTALDSQVVKYDPTTSHFHQSIKNLFTLLPASLFRKTISRCCSSHIVMNARLCTLSSARSTGMCVRAQTRWSLSPRLLLLMLSSDAVCWESSPSLSLLVEFSSCRESGQGLAGRLFTLGAASALCSG